MIVTETRDALKRLVVDVVAIGLVDVVATGLVDVVATGLVVVAEVGSKDDVGAFAVEVGADDLVVRRPFG